MAYENINDYELVYMINDGDEDSYKLLYTKYHPLLSKIAKYYHHYNKNIGIEYDDLYQEGMIGLENALKDYNGNTSLFYTYALICIKREMERLIKSQRRQKHSLLNTSCSMHGSIGGTLDLYIEETLYEEKDMTESIFISDYYSDLIIKFKYELNDIKSQIFELKVNGFSNREISSLLDLKKKSVDDSIRRIRIAFNKFQNKIEH